MAAGVAQEPTELPYRFGYHRNSVQGDYWHYLFDGGFDLQLGTSRIRAQRLLALTDGTEEDALLAELLSAQGLPRRGSELPSPRVVLSEDVLRARMQSLLRATGTKVAERPSTAEQLALRLLRAVYLEGDVVIEHDGLEVARCKSAYFSTIDDRATFTDVTLRLRSLDPQGHERLLIVRAPRLVREGPRITGRNVSLTTCTAGEPHFEGISSEVEIIERGSEFSVSACGNQLAFSGTAVLPLPNVSFFTSDQSAIPIQGAGAGYSQREKLKAKLDLGGSMNRTGGAIHEFLTGRRRETFRGDWHLGLGWIETRGFPLEAGWTYRGEGLYRGKTELFTLDDHGENIREIQNHLDGTRIDEEHRSLARSENRVYLRHDLSLDLQLFAPSDPAVYSEFYPRDYYEEELPETSAHLRWARRNLIGTLTGRTNLDSFSYDSDRTLADSFVREEPYFTFNWIGERLIDLPNDSGVVLTADTGIGRFRRKNDPRTPAPAFDEPTTRLAQNLELAAPLHWGALALRPYVSGAVIHYDETIDPDADPTRGVLEAGISLATRLQRTWQWTDAQGRARALRHVLSPVIRYFDRNVTEPPAAYPQFDEVDALATERAFRFELLQRLQTMRREDAGLSLHDSVWLDLAQTVYPSPDRDNSGHALGLLEYELILRPEQTFIPLPNLRYAFEGEHDWIDGMRTFNTGARFGPLLGLHWFGEYRVDRTADGSISYGVSTNLARRWDVSGSAQYDLEANQNLSYAVNLVRLDHDWRILLGVNFDIVTDDTSFVVRFEPSFGGLFRPRDRQYIAGNRAYGTGEFTDY